MKKYLRHVLVGTICLASIILFEPKANAEEMPKDDVPNSTYVIGTHMFTRDTNEETEYNGQLTTKNIMIAAKTIESDDINDMIVYYKNPRGKWTDALTSNEIEAPDVLEINYKNLELQDVVAPAAPILFLSEPLQYDNTTGDFTYQLEVFIDDIDNKDNIPDGVEIGINEGSVFDFIDLNYDDISSSTVKLNTEEAVNRYDNLLILGKTYHMWFKEITINVETDVNIYANAFKLDKNGKKVYSDTSNTHSIDGLPKVTIKNNYSNPDYIVKEDNRYYYSIGIESLDAPAYKNNLDSFRYILLETTGDKELQIGTYSLEESVYLSIEENSVKEYEAHLICYINGESYYPHIDGEKFIIDTRKLTRPQWSGEPYYDSATEKEYISINKEFYKKQEEDTLDYNILGTEIYEVMRNFDSTKKYKLIEDKIHSLHVKPESGLGIYVARVYALNANNEIVYSDFSDEIYVVTTPQLEVSAISDGKVSIKVSNSQDYMYGGYEIYTFNSADGEVLLGSANSISDVIELEINSGTEIYAKANVYFDGSDHYSDKSILYKVE